MKILNSFIYAVAAGVCIAIGGTVFLSVENPIVRALFFTVGLFTIVTNGFNLFTGKVGYLLENKPSYILSLMLIWLGNLVGTSAVALLLNLTRISGISERALRMCQTKLSDDPLSIFILAILCNVLMYVAVDGFKVNEHHLGKYLALFLGVVVFILCSFEHCVANMFYFTLAGIWSWKSTLYMLIMTLGNAVGGILIPICKLTAKKEK